MYVYVCVHKLLVYAEKMSKYDIFVSVCCLCACMLIICACIMMYACLITLIAVLLGFLHDDVRAEPGSWLVFWFDSGP
jgi:hypothetical protein